MQLIFRRFSEYFTLTIDRKNKKLKVNGESTNYQETETAWRMLWDRCERHKVKPNQDNTKCKDCIKVAEIQDKHTENLTDKKFVKIFEDQMALYGFKLARWE